MLSLNELVYLADRDGVGVHAAERDYVMSHFVSTLAANPISDRLEFKGGTSLRLCHFIDYRYSADIDINLTGGLGSPPVVAAIQETLATISERLGMPVLELNEGADQIAFVGPRGQQRPDRIKLDMSADELTGGATMRLPVFERYPDLEPSPGLPTYTLTEALAEKFRCLIQRLQCRDLFDLHHLINESRVDLDTAWSRFEEKAIHRGIDPAQFWERLDDRMRQYGERWNDEMPNYIRNYPPFDRLERELRRRLRALRP